MVKETSNKRQNNTNIKDSVLTLNTLKVKRWKKLGMNLGSEPIFLSKTNIMHKKNVKLPLSVRILKGCENIKVSIIQNNVHIEI